MFIFCVPAGGNAETFGGGAHREPIGCRRAPKQTPVKGKSKQSNAFANDKLHRAGKLWLWVPFYWTLLFHYDSLCTNDKMDPLLKGCEMMKALEKNPSKWTLS